MKLKPAAVAFLLVSSLAGCARESVDGAMRTVGRDIPLIGGYAKRDFDENAARMMILDTALEKNPNPVVRSATAKAMCDDKGPITERFQGREDWNAQAGEATVCAGTRPSIPGQP